MIQIQAPSLLDQFLDPVVRAMTPDLARELAELRATPEVQARIDELAEKCNEGQLSSDERAEYERFVESIHFIGLLQRKARMILAGGHAS